MIEFKPGRQRPVATKPRVWLSRHLTLAPEQIPTPPAVADWMSRVEDWPMYANDRMGDCTVATVAHAIQSTSTYGQGETVTVPEDAVVAKYSALSGYDPATGANDTGLVVQDVLNDWRKNGLDGHRALVFAAVDLSNEAEVKSAIALFGWVYLGINFPASAMDQFNAGEPWTVVRGSRVEGGHAIPAAAYDGGGYRVVTWGRVQEMSQEFWDRYVEEAWVVVTPEWLSAAGTSPTGLDLHELGEDFARLTGEANPFPDSGGTPAPPTSPTAFWGRLGALLAQLWRLVTGGRR